MEAMGKSAGGFDALNISPEKWEDLPPEMAEIHCHIRLLQKSAAAAGKSPRAVKYAAILGSSRTWGTVNRF